MAKIEVETYACCNRGPLPGAFGFFLAWLLSSPEPFCSSFLFTSIPLLFVLLFFVLPFPFFCSTDAEPATQKIKFIYYSSWSLCNMMSIKRTRYDCNYYSFQCRQNSRKCNRLSTSLLFTQRIMKRFQRKICFHLPSSRGRLIL